MDTTNSWFVCYRHGEQHAGDNDVWYYSQGDRSTPGWEGREAWGYMPAVNVWTDIDPWPGIPKCEPDMWQVKMGGVSDPNTGKGWSTVWYSRNTGGAYLYRDPDFTTPVGLMDTTTSWFVCYSRGVTHSGGNDVWYYTQGDRSIPGWEGRQAWGFMPAADVATRFDPYDSIPACSASSPESPKYREAIAQGFGTVPSYAQRLVTDTGARTGDDGVIAMRWFIPSAGAAGGLLLGDDRGFSDDPKAAEKSRAVLTWDVATGRASLTVTHSTTVSGLKIPALPIKQHSICTDVKSTDLSKRDTNDVFVGEDGGGLHICISLLNSLTNRIDVAAWSVDVKSGLITPRNPGPGGAGGYDFDFRGNGYPAIEANYYPRYQDAAHRLFRRQVDPFVSRDVDEGGGLAALDLESWFQCLTDATGKYASVCFWDDSINNPARKDEYYFTPW